MESAGIPGEKGMGRRRAITTTSTGCSADVSSVGGETAIIKDDKDTVSHQ